MSPLMAITAHNVITPLDSLLPPALSILLPAVQNTHSCKLLPLQDQVVPIRATTHLSKENPSTEGYRAIYSHRQPSVHVSGLKDEHAGTCTHLNKYSLSLGKFSSSIIQQQWCTGTRYIFVFHWCGYVVASLDLHIGHMVNSKSICIYVNPPLNVSSSN